MFTGLIESVGTIAAVTPAPGGFCLRIATSFANDLRDGDSVAVNGVCLTVTSHDADAMIADIGPETARVTTLGSLRPGDAVNLERAMRADQRFGGHLVQGHVDGTGTLTQVREEGESRWLTITYPPALAPFFIRKGSVAVDGISLTVATLAATQFEVMIIPFTWEHTALRSLRPGQRVNLECDMVGKYVARAAELFADRAL